MRFLAILLGFLPLVSSAQEKGPRRTCRVLYLGDRGTAPEVLHLHDGTKTLQVDLPRMNLSKPYPLPTGAITLNLLPAALAEGLPVPAGMPSVAVGEDVSTFYLMVTPDPANKAVPVRMQVIDASAERFKLGQMLWFNLTALDVGGQMGKEKVAIKARSKSITDAPATTNEQYNVNLSYRKAGDPALYPIFETRWVHDPAARTIVFIMSEPGKPGPRVVAFRDNPEKTEEEGKNP